MSGLGELGSKDAASREKPSSMWYLSAPFVYAHQKLNGYNNTSNDRFE